MRRSVLKSKSARLKGERTPGSERLKEAFDEGQVVERVEEAALGRLVAPASSNGRRVVEAVDGGPNHMSAESGKLACEFTCERGLAVSPARKDLLISSARTTRPHEGEQRSLRCGTTAKVSATSSGDCPSCMNRPVGYARQP
jgi:hypothetical protein